MQSLTYPQPETSWQQQELSTTAATALVISLLTTLISYQLTALFSDLTLGCKPRRTARVHTFQSLLLSRKSSPLAVLNAIFRTDALTRFYFQGNLPTRSAITRDRAKVKGPALVLLLILMLTAPVVNVLSVVLTIEKQDELSFNQAGFGGVQLTIANSSSAFKKELLTEVCSTFPVEYHAQDVGLARLSYCSRQFGPRPRASRIEGIATLSVGRMNDAVVWIHIGLSNLVTDVLFQGDLRTNTQNWILRCAPELDDVRPLVNHGMDLILKACNSSSRAEDLRERTELPSDSDSPEGEVFIMGKTDFDCDPIANETALLLEAAQEIERFVTLKKVDVMVAADPSVVKEQQDFEYKGDEIFVQRWSRVTGIPVLAIVAGLSVVLRLVAAALLNNDVTDGIDKLVKERIGVPFCRSLLGEGKTLVCYNAKSNEDESELSRKGSLKKIASITSVTSWRDREVEGAKRVIMFDGGGVTKSATSNDQIDYI